MIPEEQVFKKTTFVREKLKGDWFERAIIWVFPAHIQHRPLYVILLSAHVISYKPSVTVSFIKSLPSPQLCMLYFLILFFLHCSYTIMIRLFPVFLLEYKFHEGKTFSILFRPFLFCSVLFSQCPTEWYIGYRHSLNIFLSE